MWQGAAAPAELVEYLQARVYWRDLGVRVLPESLDDWPEAMVESFDFIIREFTKWEEAQIELARRRAQASSKS